MITAFAPGVPLRLGRCAPQTPFHPRGKSIPAQPSAETLLYPQPPANPNCRHWKGIIVVDQGGPDFLAAHHFVHAEHREQDTAAVAMLGASLSIPPDALPHFAGRRVRFFTHADAAGRTSVARWARQLAQAGARVDALALDGLRSADGFPAKDLNDLTRLHPQDLAAHPALRLLIPQA